jgi:hypothetical protein
MSKTSGTPQGVEQNFGLDHEVGTICRSKKDGTPEIAAKRFGDQVERTRRSKGLRPTELVERLYKEIDPNDPILVGINENWLKRLEAGRIVKIPRRLVDAMCRALDCNRQERARILLHADRNILGGHEKPSAVAELLNYLLDLLSEEPGFFSELLVQWQRTKLTDLEMLELLLSAVGLMIEDRKRQQSG